MNDLEKRLSIIEEKLGIVKETPKLEVGKWYVFTGHNVRSKPLMSIKRIDNNNCFFYGFDFQGKFTDSDNYSLDELDRGYREATNQEVGEALVREAKRRYKVGDKVCLIRRNVGGKYKNEIHLTDFSYETDNQLYCDGNLLIFDDGNWAEVIEQPTDKFAELKEAHRKGAVIQYKNWTTKYFLDCPDNLPKWNESTEYRIKPKQPTLEQDIQNLKDKYKQYKFTITIEDNI